MPKCLTLPLQRFRGLLLFVSSAAKDLVRTGFVMLLVSFSAECNAPVLEQRPKAYQTDDRYCLGGDERQTTL